MRRNDQQQINNGNYGQNYPYLTGSLKDLRSSSGSQLLRDTANVSSGQTPTSEAGQQPSSAVRQAVNRVATNETPNTTREKLRMAYHEVLRENAMAQQRQLEADRSAAQQKMQNTQNQQQSHQTQQHSQNAMATPANDISAIMALQMQENNSSIFDPQSNAITTQLQQHNAATAMNNAPNIPALIPHLSSANSAQQPSAQQFMSLSKANSAPTNYLSFGAPSATHMHTNASNASTTTIPNSIPTLASAAAAISQGSYLNGNSNFPTFTPSQSLVRPLFQQPQMQPQQQQPQTNTQQIQAQMAAAQSQLLQQQQQLLSLLQQNPQLLYQLLLQQPNLLSHSQLMAVQNAQNLTKNPSQQQPLFNMNQNVQLNSVGSTTGAHQQQQSTHPNQPQQPQHANNNYVLPLSIHPAATYSAGGAVGNASTTSGVSVIPQLSMHTASSPLFATGATARHSNGMQQQQSSFQQQQHQQHHHHHHQQQQQFQQQQMAAMADGKMANQRSPAQQASSQMDPSSQNHLRLADSVHSTSGGAPGIVTMPRDLLPGVDLLTGGRTHKTASYRALQPRRHIPVNQRPLWNIKTDDSSESKSGSPQPLKSRSYSYPVPDRPPYCVWLGNLPSIARDDDIIQFLGHFDIYPKDIRWGRRQGAHTCAYVDFHSKEDLKKALLSIDSGSPPEFMGRILDIDINEGIKVNREAAVTAATTSPPKTKPHNYNPGRRRNLKAHQYSGGNRSNNFNQQRRGGKPSPMDHNIVMAPGIVGIEQQQTSAFIPPPRQRRLHRLNKNLQTHPEMDDEDIAQTQLGNETGLGNLSIGTEQPQNGH